MAVGILWILSLRVFIPRSHLAKLFPGYLVLDRSEEPITRIMFQTRW
jgi:hypothetical protein